MWCSNSVYRKVLCNLEPRDLLTCPRSSRTLTRLHDIASCLPTTRPQDKYQRFRGCERTVFAIDPSWETATPENRGRY